VGKREHKVTILGAMRKLERAATHLYHRSCRWDSQLKSRWTDEADELAYQKLTALHQKLRYERKFGPEPTAR